MAISKRSTKKSYRTTKKVNRKPVNPFMEKIALDFLYGSDSDILTRSQKLQLADLADHTKISSDRWVRKAVEEFLAVWAPVYFQRARA